MVGEPGVLPSKEAACLSWIRGSRGADLGWAGAVPGPQVESVMGVKRAHTPRLVRQACRVFKRTMSVNP